MPPAFRGVPSMGAPAVAKKKTGPKPTPEGPRESLIALKCRRPYKEWVIALARKHRTTPSQIIDRALVAFAEADGFDPPPER
jgi:hypothetical protein